MPDIPGIWDEKGGSSSSIVKGLDSISCLRNSEEHKTDRGSVEGGGLVQGRRAEGRGQEP